MDFHVQGNVLRIKPIALKYSKIYYVVFFRHKNPIEFMSRPWVVISMADVSVAGPAIECRMQFDDHQITPSY